MVVSDGSYIYSHIYFFAYCLLFLFFVVSITYQDPTNIISDITHQYCALSFSSNFLVAP